MRKTELLGGDPELNITPLVDVMLVLLVVLMLIMPALTFDENIRLPEGSQQQPSAATGLRVSITKSSITLNSQRFDHVAFFDNLLMQTNNLSRSSTVYIAGDKDLKYDLIMRVMTAFKRLGFSKISLQTK